MTTWLRVLFSAALGATLALAPSAAQEPAAPSMDHAPAASVPADNPASIPAPIKEAPPKLDLTPDAQGKLSQQQMQDLLRVVADKDIENDKRLRDYTYIEHEVQNNLDGKGNRKSTEIKTFEILEIYGEQVQRLIEKGDKPLNAKDAAKEEEKIQKIIDKRKNESEESRKKREEKEAKQREEDRKFDGGEQHLRLRLAPACGGSGRCYCSSFVCLVGHWPTLNPASFSAATILGNR